MSERAPTHREGPTPDTPATVREGPAPDTRATLRQGPGPDGRPTLRDLLDGGGVHLLDGAMGTVLYERGFFVNVCYDELSCTEPALVEAIHREYVDAGADLLETNTFGANPVKLSGFGLEDRTEEINRAAAERARAAIAAVGRPEVLVLGAIGPLGIRIEPWGPTSEGEAEAYFGRQVDGLAAGGVDGFLLETFQDIDELHQALRAVRVRSSLPLLAQVTIEEGGRTAYGTDVERVADALEEWGADAVGLNCSVGPVEILEAIERMAEVTELPLLAQPNAGLPRTVGDRKMYLASPEYMGRYARRMVDAGVRFVGGCCGTTPEHVRVMGEAIGSETGRRRSGEPTKRGAPRAGAASTDAATAATPPANTAPPPTNTAPPPAGAAARDPAAKTATGATAPAPARAARKPDVPLRDPVPLADRSPLGRKLAEGAFVTSLELVPPRGWDPSILIADARRARLAGVDVVTLPDAPRGFARMSSLPAALLVHRETGLEVVPHYACRDRNMLGMISDLMGAAGSQIRNVLVVTGDLSPAGPYPEHTAVFDIDSIGLTNVLHHLNRGVDPGDHPVEPPTQFVIGVVLNHDAADRERERTRYHWKVEAGAEFAVTQPVFEPEALERFLDEAGERPIPVIAGLWPLDSLRTAEFLENEVPGVRVPVEVMERMGQAEAEGSEAARAEGVRIAVETARALRPRIAGIHVSSARGRLDLALEVIRQVAREVRT